MDYRLELVIVPVSDPDRAKRFYTEQVGFIADHDFTVSDEIRFIQLTPPGSACSIAIGKLPGQPAPGTFAGGNLVVRSAEDAKADLESRGVEVSEVMEQPGGTFVYFTDPDGNRWSVQETGKDS
jgi:predicted enzyme related to lactoylglutathione lyase